MERKILMGLMMSFMMTIALISCGGDSDDDDDNDTPQEETTGTSGTSGTTGTTGTSGSTGSTGTSGSSGTSGTTGSTACLTNSQRENIRTFLNRASDLRTFNGTAQESVREEDGSISDTTLAGSIDFQQSGEDTWLVTGNLLGPTSTTEVRKTITFREGCLFANGKRARSVNASDSSLSYTYSEDNDTRVRDRASLSTGRMTINTTVTRNGSLTYELDFREIAP